VPSEVHATATTETGEANACSLGRPASESRHRKPVQRWLAERSAQQRPPLPRGSLSPKNTAPLPRPVSGRAAARL